MRSGVEQLGVHAHVGDESNLPVGRVQFAKALHGHRFDAAHDLALLVVPRKSLNFHSSSFSIATDPTNDLPHRSQFSKIAGLEVRPMIRGVKESSETRGMVGQFLDLAILRRVGNLEVCKGGAY